LNYSMLCTVLGGVFVAACGGSANETVSGPAGGASSGGAETAAAGNATGGGSLGPSDGGGGSGVGTAGQGGTVTGTAGSCKPIAACGGNVLGTWRVSQLCTADLTPQSSSGCAGATTRISGLTASGSYAFNADNTTLDNVHFTFSESSNYPGTCFTEMQCTQLQTVLATESGVLAATCSYAAIGCSCTFRFDSQITSMGTYQVNGGNITLVAGPQSTPEADTFCVSGNTLTIQNVNANGGVSTLTLTK
jgi:hypothetical protein